jgi:hypothetical protein
MRRMLSKQLKEKIEEYKSLIGYFEKKLNDQDKEKLYTLIQLCLYLDRKDREDRK